MAVWNDHGEVKQAGKTRFTSKSMALTLSDHSATHVDAPCHFNPDPKAATIDEVPLENFYTEAICLDLSHAPLKHEISVAEMEEALKASGQQIKKRDTVLIETPAAWATSLIPVRRVTSAVIRPARSVCPGRPWASSAARRRRSSPARGPSRSRQPR